MARVLLCFGGRSAEHEVSCVSAVSALEALVGRGHSVVPVGISGDGTWHLADPTKRPLAAAGPVVHLEVPGGRRAPAAPRRSPSRPTWVRLSASSAPKTRRR